MTLLSLSSRLRAALERQDESEFKRLSQTYQSMVDRLEGDIDSLSRDMATGEYSQKSIQGTESYKRLMKDSERELEAYQAHLLTELALVAGLWLGLGATNSDALLSQAFDDAGIKRDVKGLPDNVILALNRYLAEGSPLAQRLAYYAEANLDRIRQIIIDNVILGKNPRYIARLIVADGFGMGLTDALRMTRTLQLYAYRESTLLNYQQYSDVIKGWVWSSALIPGRTCMSCVNMHGSIHTLDEILNDHHNGLCAMLPLTGDNPIAENGEAWFDKQGKDTQIKMMGQLKYDAWKAGQFSFADLTGVHNDDVFGDMRIERSLKDILGGKEE